MGIRKVFQDIISLKKTEMRILKDLKGANIAETFGNVYNYNSLIKPLKELNRCSAPRRSSESIMQFAVKISKKSSKSEVMSKIKESEHLTAVLKLKQKADKGKKLSFLDKMSVNDQFRNIKNALFKNGFAISLGLLLNKDDILAAKEECGTKGMLEEIAKTSLMYTLGFGILRKGKGIVQNGATTAAVYMNKGSQMMKFAGSAASIGLACSVKPVMDTLWTTEYEKFKMTA